jgi:putative polyketide hydroxylase
MNALIADSFAADRVLLIGDATHTLPPNRGGFGANTGIEDAHNIAWKLSVVLEGFSMRRLLDTYDDEPRPMACLRHLQIFVRDDYKAHAKGPVASSQVIDDDAMDFSQLYRSAAVLQASKPLQPAMRPEKWAGKPGTRASHFWESHGGKRVFTLDLFQRGWILSIFRQRAIATQPVLQSRANTGRHAIRATVEGVKNGVHYGPVNVLAGMEPPNEC